MDSQVTRLHINTVMDHGGEWSHSNVFGVELKQDVMHGSVTDNSHILDILYPQSGIFLSLFRDLNPFLLRLAFLSLDFLFRRMGGIHCALKNGIQTLHNVGTHLLKA